jgi:hypothetical protein
MKNIASGAVHTFLFSYQKYFVIKKTAIFFVFSPARNFSPVHTRVEEIKESQKRKNFQLFPLRIEVSANNAYCKD